MKEGQNIFDPNDDFYNDICTQYTTKNDTDILLTDRKKTYFNENLTYCQSGCTYKNIIVETNKVQCECSIVEEQNYEVSNAKFDKADLVKSFFDIDEFSNFKIIICYNLVFSKKGQTYNIGSYLLIILLLVFLIIQIKFIVNQKQLVANLIKKLLNSLNIEIKHIYEIPFNMKKAPPKKIIKKNYISFNYTKKKNINNNSSSQIKLFGSINITKSVSNSKKNNIKKGHNSKIILNERNKNNKLKNTKIRNCIENTIKTNSKNNLKNNKKKNLINDTKNKINDNNKTKKVYRDDEELNLLSYKEAVIYDKREFKEYYCSLLMKKDLIFFSFLSNNNYNLRAIKLGIFVFNISLDITVNSFFFHDKNIHQIYTDNGFYNILFQLPQIIYSSAILVVINMIIQYFALSENNILKIKSNNNRNKILIKSIHLFKCLRIKFNFFFIFGFAFLCFFWYFISAFCAVYRNTQKTYLKNCIFSFSLSMIYRLIENIIPAFLRIQSIKMKNGKFVFILSKVFSIL